MNEISNTLKTEIGINIMSNFDNGIGNAFEIAILVLFIAIFLSLFINRKTFIYFVSNFSTMFCT
ncbi:hypothetical protein [Clostridium beijerinckii]|uniref:Uncharacterized protein n=1 Tax=Clostridium beijerinckii TaxID=1520 RepID=A0A7X9SSC6_CLOBE|nr:hypothetical protein [Clostridium beijerinckii]NMF07119.1 hypothetical protein [Clostridium beijerinckii]